MTGASRLVSAVLAAFYFVHDSLSNVHQSSRNLLLNCMNRELKKSFLAKRCTNSCFDLFVTLRVFERAQGSRGAGFDDLLETVTSSEARLQ